MPWKIDNAHSQVEFKVRHMMITNVSGWFERFNGTVEFDETDPIQSRVHVQIEVASIDTKEPKRDDHLRSADFFNAAQYPYLTYQSRRVEKIDATHGKIVGDLTIRDVSREVVLFVEYTGQARSPWGGVSAGFNTSLKIDRKDWGLNWNTALETGGILVGDEITIDIQLEIVKQAEPAQTAAVAP